MEISKEVGFILRERRKMLRLTQQQLAKRAEITSGYISRLERGGTELTKPTLQALLRALEIPEIIAKLNYHLHFGRNYLYYYLHHHYIP